MQKTNFRLVLDPPYDFATEPGYTHTRHSHDFRIEPGTLSDTAYRDPITGLVMLKPSYLTSQWYNAANWWTLSDWNLRDDTWDTSQRSSDLGQYFLSTHASDPNIPFIGLLIDIGIVAINAATSLDNDQVVWAMQSKNNLAADEGFVIHYHSLQDKFARYSNFMVIQWADVQIRIAPDGTMECYRHTNGLNNPAVLFDVFQIANAGELFGQEGYFAFIPMPQYGLAVYHSLAAQHLATSTSSAQSGALRGHLIKLPNIGNTDTGGYSVLASSKVMIALPKSLSRTQHVIGFHRIRYPASGTFVDSVFDPGYRPTVAPTASVGLLYTKAFVDGVVSCSAAAVKPVPPVAAYSVADGDEQGRIRHVLGTTNPVYSPFVAVNNITVPVVRTTRATTAITLSHEGATDLPDRLINLEFSDDEKGRFEGSATIFVQSDALRKVIERGDMTFRLDKSFDGGATWHTHAGGLAAVDGDVDIYYSYQGCYFIARIEMADMFARFNEATQINQPAYDEKILKECIDQVLFSVSEPVLSSYPAVLDMLKMPVVPKGSSFRFAPQIGQHGQEILNDVLLLARSQNVEFRLRHDWDAHHWFADQKPRDTSAANTWTGTPLSEEIVGGIGNPDTRFFLIGGEGQSGGKFSIYPPEANILQPFGLSTTSVNDATRVAGSVAYNKKSLTDPSSYDYLGRTRGAAPMFGGLSDVPKIDQMTRRVYDVACGRRVVGVVPSSDYIDALGPLCRVHVRIQNEAGAWINWDIRTPDNAAPLQEDGSRAELVGFWVKRRTVSIRYDGPGEKAPSVAYHLDTLWEGDIK